jgi:hypothetical protein
MGTDAIPTDSAMFAMGARHNRIGPRIRGSGRSRHRQCSNEWAQNSSFRARGHQRIDVTPRPISYLQQRGICPSDSAKRRGWRPVHLSTRKEPRTCLPNC